MRRRWWLVALAVACLDLGMILARPEASKALLRTIYVWLWEIAPKPEGVEIPDRFL
jgi:hypothetical protein